MVLNFSNKYQFRTCLKLDNEIIEIVDKTKLLGTITNDLKWDENVDNIVFKKAFARMQLIRKLSGFGAPMGDLQLVYITYIRSLCEQSSSVLHSSLTLQSEEDLERIQKVALKIILQSRYKDYQSALNILELQLIKDRREDLCLRFAQKCLCNPKM